MLSRLLRRRERTVTSARGGWRKPTTKPRPAAEAAGEWPRSSITGSVTVVVNNAGMMTAELAREVGWKLKTGF